MEFPKLTLKPVAVERDPLIAEPYDDGHVFTAQYPSVMADVAAAELYNHQGHGRLNYYKGDWYTLGDYNVWRKLHEGALEKRLVQWMSRQYVWREGKPARMYTTPRQMGDILGMLKANSNMDMDTSADPTPLVYLKDAKLIVGAHVHAEPYVPEDFVRFTLPFTQAEWAGASVPFRWLAFLKEGFSATDIQLLQEFFGYCLTTSTAYDKFLWIQGLAGSGKSTTNNVLMWLVGENNMAAMDAKRLKSQFNAKLEGKRLFNFADYRSGPWDDDMLNFCLRVAGREVIPIERKGIDAYDVRLDGKICSSSQDWPFFRDSGKALTRRILPLRRFKPKDLQPDRGLETKLRDELPGILEWAVEGLQRLTARGGFDDSLIDAKTLETITTALDVMVAFIGGYLVLDPEGKISRTDFMSLWKAYAKEKNVFSNTEAMTVHRCAMAAQHHYGAEITEKGTKWLLGVRGKTAKELLAEDEGLK